MSPTALLCFLLLSLGCWGLVHSHMLLEDMGYENESSSSSMQDQRPSDDPPVLIVELPKSAKKDKKTDKKPKKNKFIPKSKRPPPPANCVPLWGSCKLPNTVCCEFCAFCHCRLFKTVCYCRMGYPRC